MKKYPNNRPTFQELLKLSDFKKRKEEEKEEEEKKRKKLKGEILQELDEKKLKELKKELEELEEELSEKEILGFDFHEIYLVKFLK